MSLVYRDRIRVLAGWSNNSSKNWGADRGGAITWSARADFESGLAGFIIQRDSRDLARLLDKPERRFGKPLFQGLSYHDTPTKPLPEMRFPDTTAKPGPKQAYRIIAVNSARRRSEASKEAEPR